MTAVNPVNEWLALMRVHEGGVTTLGGRRSGPDSRQQVCVTRAGQPRYAELNGNRERRHGR